MDNMQNDIIKAFQEEAKIKHKAKNESMRKWYTTLFVCTVFLWIFTRMFSSEDSVEFGLFFANRIYVVLIVWTLINMVIAEVHMADTFNNRIKNNFFKADAALNKILRVVTYSYVLIPVLIVIYIITKEEYSFGKYLLYFLPLFGFSIPVIIRGIRLLLANKNSYSEEQKKLIQNMKNMTVEQLVLVENQTSFPVRCIDYNPVTGRILASERELKEILGRRKTKALVKNVENRVYLISENNSEGVTNSIKRILEKQSENRISLKSYITVLNVGFSVQEPEQYKYYEALFYGPVERQYQLLLDDVEQLWQNRDSLREIDLAASVKKINKKKLVYKFSLAALLLCSAIYMGINFDENEILFNSFLIFLAGTWLIKKIKNKRISYQSDIIYAFFSWGLFLHGFTSFVSMSYAFLPEFISVWVISRLKKISLWEVDTTKVSDFTATYNMDSSIQKMFNTAFKDPLKYCKKIETNSGISMPDKFAYGKLHTFFQNALLFPNASRSAMALLDYIEMCLRLVLYNISLQKDSELKQEVVSFNLRKMAETIYLSNLETKTMPLERNISLGALEQSILHMLSNELQVNFSGKEIDFVGLVSIITLVRNKLVAHGVMREDNITMLWIFLVYASIQITVYLNIHDFNVMFVNDEYQIGHTGHITSGGKYIINYNGDDGIVSSADKKRKKFVYTNYFNGELIVPEFIEESIDTI